MVEEEQVARWIIGLAEEDEADDHTQQFLDAARLAWPHVLAHTRRKLSGRGLTSSEVTSATFEIWEEVLRSVWGTLRRHPDAVLKIRSMENYLIGVFHHRLNRRLKYGRLNDAVIEFLPPDELAARERVEHADQEQLAHLNRRLQMEKVYAQLDDKMKKALVARIYGFSWGEIAEHFQIEEKNLIMRVRYAVRRVRERLSRDANSEGRAE
jgi:DNA-directed RNA polymerase specialized sigma24 family protein